MTGVSISKIWWRHETTLRDILEAYKFYLPTAISVTKQTQIVKVTCYVFYSEQKQMVSFYIPQLWYIWFMTFDLIRIQLVSEFFMQDDEILRHVWNMFTFGTCCPGHSIFLWIHKFLKSDSKEVSHDEFAKLKVLDVAYQRTYLTLA